MVYWLNRGTDTEILNRKRLFSAHRGAFEHVLLSHKDAVIGRITRRIGSGPEVTFPTARYFDGLLRLLIDYADAVDSDQFRDAHSSLIEELSPPDSTGATVEPISVSRTFRGRTRAGVVVPNFIKMFQTCPICGGRFLPSSSTQIDHRVNYAHGGPTTPNNGQETHPFCNNQKEFIEGIKGRQLEVELPAFGDPSKLPAAEQLSFLDFFDAAEEEEELDDYETSDEDSVEPNEAEGATL